MRERDAMKRQLPLMVLLVAAGAILAVRGALAEEPLRPTDEVVTAKPAVS